MITQYNLWSFVIEEYDIANLAECRADVYGDLVRWDQPYWIERNLKIKWLPTFELCSGEDGGTEGRSLFLFPDLFDFYFYNAFCYNLGGLMPTPTSDENYHELMDEAEVRNIYCVCNS